MPLLGTTITVRTASIVSTASVLRIVKSFVGISLIVLVTSCAHLKFINPFEDIKPEDVEPRVSFVDKEEITVTPSKLPPVNPEVVIASYKRLLQRGNPIIRKEALRRLADLTMRLAETKLAIDDEKTLANLTPAVKAASFAEAAALYEQLILEFPDYENMANVKYQLARAHSLNSEPEKSLEILDQIAVAPVKASSYVESQFRRGESYFVRKKYRVAEQAYSEVLVKGKGTDFYDKALYKRGWSLFKQSLYPEAQTDFFELFERLSSQKSQNSKLTGDLIKDTKRVISLSFYNMDGAPSLVAYFDKVGRKDYEDQIYDSLAKLYIDQERFQDAADTYLGFIDRNPLSKSSPDFHTQVIEIYKKGGFPSLILPAKESFVVNYGRTSEFWRVHQGEVVEKIKPQLRLHLDDTSRFYHAEAQKSNKPTDYLVAAKWYKEILDTFSEPSIDSKYRFLMAEALSSGNDFAGAAREYEVVAYKNPMSEYSRDAGYRALVAYQQISHPNSASKAQQYAQTIKSGLAFGNKFPQDKESANILARVAEQQLTIKDIPAAIQTSRILLTLAAPPSKKQTDRAQVIIANGLFDLKKYAEAESAISDLFKSVKLTSAQKKSFHQRRAEAIYKQAEDAKEKNNLQDAVALFLKIGQVEPLASVNINAQYDAASLLLQMKQWDRATGLLENFRKKYPKHKLSEDIPEKLALVYEEQKQWDKAANEYQKLAEKSNDKDFARDGFWRVAELYKKSGNSSKAIASFKHYVWTYPQPYLLAQEGRKHLVDLYLEQADLKKTTFWRQKIVQFYEKAGKQNNARTGFLAAESKYILSEPLFNAYKKIKLRLPLAKTLKKKRAAMKKALNAYETIAKYQIAKFTTASTHRIGEIYQILSDDLMSSQRPKGMNEEELEEYGFLLEDQALPFEDKAIGIYELNAARTKDLIFDDSVRKSIAVLAKLKPAQYNKQEQLEAIEDVSF